MLGSRICSIITIALTAICLAAVGIGMVFTEMFGGIAQKQSGDGYEEWLFGETVMSVNITADENEWADMIENKMDKEYIACDVEINGEKFESVGIRPKGNSSLTSSIGERVSFRLNFDYYIKNQTCRGLGQLVLNNTHADSTFMKDYVAYDLMEYAGVKAPLHNFASIRLNGEPFGFYIAAEVYDEDYIERVFNDSSVRLYNVKSSGLGEYERAVVDSESAKVISTEGMESAFGMGGMPPMPPGGEQGGMPPMPPDGGQGGPPAPPGSGNGGDLLYTDDNTESYTNIFANAVFDDTRAADYARVLRAIKRLNKENVTSEELEEYWEIDEILRYLAVHTFLVNTDSYSSNMAQNYFLAERDGKITVLPWDYNLSFGAFAMGGPGGPGEHGGKPGKENNLPPNGGNANDDKTVSAINFAIDTPVDGVEMSERPLISVLLGIDEYRERYYKYIDSISVYAASGFIDKLNIIEKEIYPYIEEDATAAVTAEEQAEAFKAMCGFLRLRCESIRGQVNGSIPSTTEEQKEHRELLVNAGDISINDMGTMGGPDGGPPAPPETGNGAMVPPEMGMGAMQPPEMGIGEMPPPPPGMDGFGAEQTKGGGAMLWISMAVILTGIAGALLFRRNA